MDEVRRNKEYGDWISSEKEEEKLAFSRYKSKTEDFGTRYSVLGTRKIIITRVAAAILILALGSSVWIKKDDIFKPKFSEDQIELAYEHTIKILSTYSKSISKTTSSLKTLNLDITQDDI